MQRPKFYYNELFKMNYYFCLGWDAVVFNKYLKKNFNHETDCSGKAGKSLLVEADQGRIIIIWVRSVKDLSVIAHECVHAAYWTLNAIGIDARNDDAETLSYVVENLFSKCIKYAKA